MKNFYLFGEIDDSTLSLVESINEYHDELYQSKAPHHERSINLIMSSEGGEENAGYAIYDTLMAYRKFGAVFTSGYGQICSIASLILQAGDERRLSPNCVFMIHNGHIKIDEALDDKAFVEMQTFFKNNNQRYYANIAKRASVPIDTVRKWCNNETYFSAEEAIKANLADKIIKVL